MVTCRPYVVASSPQLAAPMRPAQAWKLSVQLPRCDTLQHIHHLCGHIPRRTTDKQVYMIRPHRQCLHFPVPRCTNLADQFLQPPRHIPRQYLAAVPRNPNKVVGQPIDRVCSPPCFHACYYSTSPKRRLPLSSGNCCPRMRETGLPPRRKRRGFRPEDSMNLFVISISTTTKL